ncbi:hypothetical protein H4W81_004765 [Nonomuraea africana]|uniref:Uncharacterized protein n=1 Tax=Nonomuraea africana TaxID=46171 RepID=A0ABR9KJN1_9ACTN|nr:hypothetical protein [Nonomuraea africana]
MRARGRGTRPVRHFGSAVRRVWRGSSSRRVADHNRLRGAGTGSSSLCRRSTPSDMIKYGDEAGTARLLRAGQRTRPAPRGPRPVSRGACSPSPTACDTERAFAALSSEG